MAYSICIYCTYIEVLARTRAHAHTHMHSHAHAQAHTSVYIRFTHEAHFSCPHFYFKSKNCNSH
uniref:Uncharacterized protein n=1 Tax=Anguilla anguilla TaxID=7936 RepID=A0A0E9S6C5_ANGAN